jgi:pantetheine-phosphate adenylyltransferase
MKKIAVFPGSFDPITYGHVDVVERSLPLFDEIIIAIGVNSQKQSLYPLEKRKEWIKMVFANQPKVSVDHYEVADNQLLQIDASIAYYSRYSFLCRF